MKIILSIIIMFLSTQSFADLKGKALICDIKEDNAEKNEYKDFNIDAYIFYSSKKYKKMYIGYTSKKATLYTFEEKYSTDPDYIYFGNNNSADSVNKVNRKTLEYTFYWETGGSPSFILRDSGTCKVVNDIKALERRMENIRDKLQESLDKKYQDKSKGNKI